MPGLSVAHKMALGALIERCSDATLKTLAKAVSLMGGDKAEELKRMFAAETLDRARRAYVLAPLTPMFRPRADGVEALVFPSAVLPRLWKAASAREPQMLARLDKDGPEAVAVADRICAAAAGLVRDRPDDIWPSEIGGVIPREDALPELAACLDLAHLVRRALPSLQTWLKRPDADQVAALRLLIKDCAGVSEDGAERLMEILFAHLDDAVLILRILTQTSGAAERESFLCESELAGFVERLIVGIDERAARVAVFKPGPDLALAKAVNADLGWSASVLAELDVTLSLQPDSAWGRSVQGARQTLARQMNALLKAADRAAAEALPTERVQLSGRMTRQAPRLDAPTSGETVEAARILLRLVGAARGPAAVFGVEGARAQLVETLTERLSSWADEALTTINDGEAPDEDHALALIEIAARSLDLIEAKDAARAVRRRAAVAGGPRAGAKASSQAA
jgi:hypothetical protein